MFAQAIWLAGICLEALLVFRIWRARNFRVYPLFLSYVTFVLVQEILSYSVAHLYPAPAVIEHYPVAVATITGS